MVRKNPCSLHPRSVDQWSPKLLQTDSIPCPSSIFINSHAKVSSSSCESMFLHLGLPSCTSWSYARLDFPLPLSTMKHFALCSVRPSGACRHGIPAVTLTPWWGQYHRDVSSHQPPSQPERKKRGGTGIMARGLNSLSRKRKGGWKKGKKCARLCVFIPWGKEKQRSHCRSGSLHVQLSGS